MARQDNKQYLARPEGQPNHVPQSYVRDAPGVFIEKEEIPTYALDAAMRWRGLGNDREAERKSA